MFGGIQLRRCLGLTDREEIKKKKKRNILFQFNIMGPENWKYKIPK